MKNDLIDRYIYAVTKNLPSKSRADIDTELRTLIDDMLEERCKDVLPTEHDIKVVLTELGTPSELAEKYHPNSSKYLIGPQYYQKYKFILTIVLISTAFGLSLAGIITAVMESQTTWYVALSSWFGMIFMGLLYAFAFITILFVIFERKGIAVNISTENLDNLPPVPQEKAEISKWESVFGIAISVIFCVVFLTAPQIFCMTVNGKDFIPIFNTETIKSIWYIILAFSALGVIRECFKLYEGRYTKRLLLITIVTDILSAILSFVFLLYDRIINKAFVSSIIELLGKDEEIFAVFFSNFNIFFLGIILFALVLDMVTDIVKTYKYDLSAFSRF